MDENKKLRELENHSRTLAGNVPTTPRAGSRTERWTDPAVLSKMGQIEANLFGDEPDPPTFRCFQCRDRGVEIETHPARCGYEAQHVAPCPHCLAGMYVARGGAIQRVERRKVYVAVNRTLTSSEREQAMSGDYGFLDGAV